jgi:hypothetical protein
VATLSCPLFYVNYLGTARAFSKFPSRSGFEDMGNRSSRSAIKRNFWDASPEYFFNASVIETLSLGPQWMLKA